MISPAAAHAAISGYDQMRAAIGQKLRTDRDLFFVNAISDQDIQLGAVFERDGVNFVSYWGHVFSSASQDLEDFEGEFALDVNVDA